MSGNKTRDIVLMLVLGVLIVLALLPARDRSSDSQTEESDERVIGKARVQDPDEEARDQGNFGATMPVLGVLHQYLPIISGSTWLYRVSGPLELGLGKRWTLKIVSAPNGDEPGLLEMGFDDKLSSSRIWLDGETVRLEGLSMVEPTEFLGNRPVRVSGEFLPVAERIGQDAVWIQDSERELIYQYRDKRGRPQQARAKARQRDRAHVKGFEKVNTPSGGFKACRVHWLSRIELETEGRPVLRHLTAEPFRNETMWLTSGIGIVKRRITYTRYKPALIIFELLKYSRPDLKLLED